MKKSRKKKTARPRWLALLACVLILPACMRFFWNNGELLESAGQRAAVLSAALNMPEGGMELLEERFREQLYVPAPEYEPEPDPPVVGQEWPPSIPPENLSPAAGETSGSSGDASEPAVKPPKIPEQYKAALIGEDFSVTEAGPGLVTFGAGQIKNSTDLSDERVAELLQTPPNLQLADAGEPQVLIVHTHATESFERYDADWYDTRNTWRSRDNNNNMVAVGAAMADVLEEKGVGVIHDTTQHDYPSYNGSYERSAATIREYLDEYPSIKIVLDLHRDAMERENQTIVKPVTTINGKKAAQIMIICACDDGSVGVPDYAENLRFAAHFQSYMTTAYPGLTRPVYFCYRKYNMDLSPGSLLLEFGSNGNTLDEAAHSATLAAEALADFILDASSDIWLD